MPELVDDCGVLDVYSFSDGLVTQPMVTRPYGVGGCVYYECAPYKNSIRTFGHGTENYYDTYYEIKDGVLTRLYAREGFYDSEKVNYENYTDEQLSDEELKARMSERDSYEYEEIHWKYTYKEVLELLP